METIKAGIIGCGKVGPFHAAAYQKIENCELCAVYDVQEDRAKAFAEKFGAKAYTSIEAMVKENGLDMVSVCTACGTRSTIRDWRWRIPFWQ